MERELSAPELSALIGAVYDCALDPQLWPEALTRLRTAMDFHNAFLGLNLLPSGLLLLQVSSGIEEHWLRRIPQYSADVVAQWGGPDVWMQHSIDEPAVLSQVNPAGGTEHNRYFREWARPQGLVDVMAAILARDSSTLGTIGFGRHQDAGPITAFERQAARLLIPHLQRAVAISRLLDLKAVASEMFESTIDTLSVGVIFTNVRLEVLHANPAARRMLQVGAPVQLKNGALSVASLKVADALAQAVAGISTDEARFGSRGLGLPAWTPGGEPFVFHVLPLQGREFRSVVRTDAPAAIFISPVSRSLPIPGPDSFALFGLTPSEVAVFQKVVAGMALGDIAAGSGISLSTAKTHLQRIFDKTGCHRQADLVALAASMRLPIM